MGQGGTLRTGDCICFDGKRNDNHQLGTEIFVHHRIISELREQYFVVIECHI
jgi:hypothetical protein